MNISFGKNFYLYCFNIYTDTSSHNDTSTAYKAPINPETRKQLRRELDLEYDFYYFVKQRFYKQLMKVRKARG